MSDGDSDLGGGVHLAMSMQLSTMLGANPDALLLSTPSPMAQRAYHPRGNLPLCMTGLRPAFELAQNSS